MTSPHEAGVGTGLHDPDQEQPAGDKAATLEGGSSWYWTNMLNFSQSGSSSTYTSAGQVAGSQITAGSPPSSSSVHNNNIIMNPNNNNNGSNNQLNQGSLLPSCNNNTASNNDPESAVWGQDFLTGPICDSKATMAGCSPDDGLQELLYPRSVRELLLDVQSPSWDLLHQAAINKSFGFPLGPDDQMGSAHLHGLPPTNQDVHPLRAVQSGLHFSHDDRLSCSTASSTLSDSALAGAEPHWPVTEAAVTDHAAQGAARACLMHVPQTTFFQHQFDHTRVKEEYAPHLSASCCATSSSALAKAGAANPFLLQHQQQQHSLRLMNPAQVVAGMQLKETAMANLNADVKPSKHQIHSWPGSPAAAATCIDLTGGQVHCAGGAAPVIEHDHLLLNSLKTKNHQHVHNAGFLTAASPSLVNQEASFFQIPDHHKLIQEAGLQAHLHRHAAAGVLNNQPLQYLHQQAGGLKKSRAHLEIGHTNVEPARDVKGVAGSPDDFALKRPKVESQQQPTSSGSFKPVRKEKLGERITTLQQLVSPYGKTDTASVLLEAIGYIKFLQEQVQTLSSPYLKSATNSTSQNVDKNQNGEEPKPDLRSKGLCLVPLSCTMQVANDNGADYWYGGAFR